jgi:hypothetical protein
MFAQVFKELRELLLVFSHQIYRPVRILPHYSHLASVAWYLRDEKAKKLEMCEHRHFLTKTSL